MIKSLGDKANEVAITNINFSALWVYTKPIWWFIAMQNDID